MKRLALTIGLLGLNAASAASASASASAAPSCDFQGLYASGCIEFVGSSWTSEGMQEFCQSQSRPGETVSVTANGCAKANFNSLCASKKGGDSIADIYVNDMPAFICSRYLKGELTTRAAGGW